MLRSGFVRFLVWLMCELGGAILAAWLGKILMEHQNLPAEAGLFLGGLLGLLFLGPLVYIVLVRKKHPADMGGGHPLI